MLNTIFTIAQNTFRETMRDRILLAALAVVLIIIAFTLFIASISIEQDVRMIVDFGTSAIYILQIFVAIFIGSMLMYKEVEQKTFFLILPKPIRRYEIILGKALGLTATTFTVTLLSTLALFAILLTKGATLFVVPILLSVFLSTLEAMILILISIVFSGFTSPILSAIYTIVFFLAGHAGESLRPLIMFPQSTVIEVVARGIYYLLPNLEKFNIRNDIVFGDIPNATSIIFSLLYALFYASLLFFVASVTFKKKEF
ncbi:MAG: hypothetical protein QG653_422 [Patescibacteria group bacterium]|nr:hypothetical protein [Patescibacteria group bacterium]